VNGPADVLATGVHPSGVSGYGLTPGSRPDDASPAVS
jgi:hypothetical protein